MTDMMKFGQMLLNKGKHALSPSLPPSLPPSLLPFHPMGVAEFVVSSFLVSMEDRRREGGREGGREEKEGREGGREGGKNERGISSKAGSHLPPSLPPFLPPSLLPSFPPSLLPSFPPSLQAS